MGSRRRGSVLVAVLWCFALLGITVVSMLHTSQLELRIVKNHADRIQARFLALAGVEKARAVLLQDSRRLEGEARSFDGAFLDDPADFGDVPMGRGMFRVIRSPGAGETPGRTIFGLADLGGRLDVNRASAEELRLLPGMTEEIAAAIIDWRDGDHETSPGGAEVDYYASLALPYLCRDGPIESILELLRVRGIAPDLLLGEDANGNGSLDPAEDDGPARPPMDDADGVLDGGWSDLLCVESRVLNITNRGERRVDLKTAKEDVLTRIDGISPELAKAIAASRKFESIANLLDVTAVVETAPGQPGQPSPTPPDGASQAQPQAPGGPATPGSTGEKLVNEALFRTIADAVSVGPETELRGLVNINTAGAAVLACLPGMTDELAAAVISWRGARGNFQTVADLLDVPGMTQEAFKKVCPRITTRAGTFRILAEGTVPSTGARARILAIVRLGDDDVRVLDLREDP
jgi:competence ComEA-like helix-hairpin-helix protein